MAAATVVFGAAAISLVLAVEILSNSAALAPRVRVLFFLPLGLSGVIVLGRVLFRMLRQIAKFHASAVWLERDRLIYLDNNFFNVKVSDIASISLERRGFWPLTVNAVVVRFRDGTAKGITGVLLDEPPQATVAKLKRLISRD